MSVVMSLAESYVKSLQVARNNAVLDGLLATLKRRWQDFSTDEKKLLLHHGKTARERINRPEEDAIAEVPARDVFEELKACFTSAKTRDEVRQNRKRVDELVCAGTLQRWQTNELFILEIDALRRIWETEPLNVSAETYKILEQLIACQTREEFDAILRDSYEYTLSKETEGRAGDTQADKEFWILEQAFSVKSESLRRQPKQKGFAL